MRPKAGWERGAGSTAEKQDVLPLGKCYAGGTTFLETALFVSEWTFEEMVSVLSVRTSAWFIDTS